MPPVWAACAFYCGRADYCGHAGGKQPLIHLVARRCLLPKGGIGFLCGLSEQPGEGVQLLLDHWRAGLSPSAALCGLGHGGGAAANPLVGE